MAQAVDTTTSKFHTGRLQMPSPQGAEVLCAVDNFSFATTKSVTDIAALFPLPPGCVPVDLILSCSDGDTGTSLLISVGLLNAAKTAISTTTPDGGAAWIASSTAGQTGVIARPTTTVITSVEPSTSVRYVGVTIITNGSATALTGKVTMTYRASQGGV
jgi:hypothetical protein